MKIEIDLEKFDTEFKIGETVYWSLFNNNGTKRIVSSKIIAYGISVFGSRLDYEEHELQVYVCEYFLEIDETNPIPTSFLSKSYNEAFEKIKEYNNKKC